MSVRIVDGKPFINGKPTTLCEREDCFHLDMDLSDYICPDCDSHLMKSGSCLNSCHLSGAAYRTTMRHASGFSYEPPEKNRW